MNIKHKKLLFIAGVINAIIGVFYLSNSIIEFANILQTKANTLIQTAGIQLSYLIFVSAIFTSLAGITAILNRNSLRLINVRVFLGILSLAWPLFLSITLLFTRVIINIRLLTMTLAALFYVTSVLIVKITNAESTKNAKFNPSAIISSSGKRAKSVNIGSVVSSTAVKVQNKNFLHTFENIASSIKTHKHLFVNLQSFFSGKRKNNVGFFRGLYSGKKRRSVNFLASMNRRGRRRFRR